MAVFASAAVASGVVLTLAVPFVALHELIVKRQKANMKRHLPVIKKKVNFGCERSAARAAPPPLPLTSAEEKALEAALTIPLPLPPYKPALRQRQASPQPAYDETFEEKKVARAERPCVRFAQMA
ncbi:hypothetical protein PRIPAC_75757 [Pristionchus pacificus]|uniref:Uncharacterized protein n=1 Tax=Pristionchus pacificus TaxID=54126 RepID=A0A454Y368_PRIPA|nr:hypothetical protein PRIPAC_75757 [Pristionchus pacificus]|eukprot:PDM73262.1 hypothetical protein PRIPAC_40618 [Pristionchus pacificus]